MARAERSDRRAHASELHHGRRHRALAEVGRWPWWAREPVEVGEATARAAPDHEIVMTPEGGTAARTTRRHGGWQSVEETVNGVRGLRVTHDSGLVALEYTSDNTGAPKLLSISRQ